MPNNSKPAHLETFDMADHLQTKEAVAEYLSLVLQDGDTDELLRAIGHAARAKGMANIAKATGLGRESLYKALVPTAKPRFETIVAVLKALDIELQAVCVR
jgi:probable addiction module antidote protein